VEDRGTDTLLACPLKIRSTQGEQEAEALLTDTVLELRPKYGGVRTYSYRDITEVRAAGYKLYLTTREENLELYHLGNKYDDFIRILIGQRNELIIGDLLMREKVHRGGIRAVCSVQTDSGQVELGQCYLRLCDTALLIIPDYQEPIRLPYSFVEMVKPEGYKVHIGTETGSIYSLSKLGREFDSFIDELERLRNDLTGKVQTLLRELAPSATPTAVARASLLMREGRAVRRRDLEAIDPAMWEGLERQLDAASVRQEYYFLNSLGGSDQQCIGFKRELMAQADAQEYLWFLVPLLVHNAIAMEATSGPQTGRATYFFRIAPRATFSSLGDAQLQELVDVLLTDINRCMLVINFRREPIFLPEEKLAEPKFIKYRHAVNKIPELQELRRRFIGRVFHRSQDQWEQDIRDLLAFNVQTLDEEARWAKGFQELDEGESSSPEDALGNGG
jgi:hypothetical protein